MVFLFHVLQRIMRERVFHIYLKEHTEITSGAFKGLKVLDSSSPCHFTFLHLLGTYEPHVQDLISKHIKGAKRFIDIGCASGYFSVGIPYKYKIPSIGFDIDREQIEYADRLADINNLSHLVDHIPVDFNHSYNDVFQDDDFCLIDIEGSEVDFIRNIDISTLSGVKILFELHDTSDLDIEGVKSLLIKNLEHTHDHIVSKEVVKIDFNEFDKVKNLTRNDYIYFSGDLRDIHQEWILFTPKK